MKFRPQSKLKIDNLFCSYDRCQEFYLDGFCPGLLVCCECGAGFKENPGYGFYTEFPGGDDLIEGMNKPFKYGVNTGNKWEE